MNKTLQFSLAIALGLICLAAGILVASPKSKPMDLTSAQLLPEAKKIDGINLEFVNSSRTGSEFFVGRWTLVFFGFASCPDLCPMELQKLSRLLSMTDSKDGLQVLFVSVDPERDSADKLENYLRFFNPQMKGARGENKELAKFASLFGAAYDRSFIQGKRLQEIKPGMDMPAEAGDIYQVSHSLRIFIINPEGKYVGSFAPPHEAEKLLKDMQTLINQS